jgi:hypothetical protein
MERFARDPACLGGEGCLETFRGGCASPLPFCIDTPAACGDAPECDCVRELTAMCPCHSIVDGRIFCNFP